MLDEIWVVAVVKSGLPIIIEAFLDRITADHREQYYRERINLENDETGVFEVKIGQLQTI
jgi:hypothetical protein